MSVDQAFNFKAINNAISTAGLLSEEQLSLLQQEGYHAVINLLPDDNEYAQKGEREIIENLGLSYKYIPVDFSAPNDSDYEKFSIAMKELGDKKLMIHCAANYRVSAFFAIYAHQNMGWSAAQAYELINTRWQPDDYPQWPEFIARHLVEGDT